MKRTLMLFLSVMFPWVVILFNDDPVGALIAMIMQVTIIGWIPASMWAWRTVKKEQKNKEPINKEPISKEPVPNSESRDVK